MGDVTIAGQTTNEQGKIELLNQMDAGRLRWAIPVESHLKRKYFVGHQPTVPLDRAPIPFWSVFARAAYATTMKSMAETHLAGKCFVKVRGGQIHWSEKREAISGCGSGGWWGVRPLWRARARRDLEVGPFKSWKVQTYKGRGRFQKQRLKRLVAIWQSTICKLLLQSQLSK